MNRNTQKKLERMKTAGERQAAHRAVHEAAAQRRDECGHFWDGKEYFSGADCKLCGTHVYEDDDLKPVVWVWKGLAWSAAKPSCPPDPLTHDGHAYERVGHCGVEIVGCAGKEHT